MGSKSQDAQVGQRGGKQVAYLRAKEPALRLGLQGGPGRKKQSRTHWDRRRNRGSGRVGVMQVKAEAPARVSTAVVGSCPGMWGSGPTATVGLDSEAARGTPGAKLREHLRPSENLPGV